MRGQPENKYSCLSPLTVNFRKHSLKLYEVGASTSARVAGCQGASVIHICMYV